MVLRASKSANAPAVVSTIAEPAELSYAPVLVPYPVCSKPGSNDVGVA